MKKTIEKTISLSEEKSIQVLHVLNGAYTGPDAYSGGRNLIERHYPGIILRHKRKFDEKNFTFYEITITSEANPKMVNRLKEMVR